MQSRSEKNMILYLNTCTVTRDYPFEFPANASWNQISSTIV